MSDIDQTLNQPTPAASNVAEDLHAHTPGAGAPGAAAGGAAAGPAGPSKQEDGQTLAANDAAAGDGASLLQGDLEQLMAAAAQRDEYLALAQRTQADFENYRKRVAREAGAALERGISSLAKELLPAIDNLDRALDAAAQDDPLLDGVRLVRSELGAALARLGVEVFVPLGEAFDPNLHEAVAQQPVEGANSGDVAEVFQNGYRMGETIIRPARVLVAA